MLDLVWNQTGPVCVSSVCKSSLEVVSHRASGRQSCSDLGINYFSGDRIECQPDRNCCNLWPALEQNRHLSCWEDMSAITKMSPGLLFPSFSPGTHFDWILSHFCRQQRNEYVSISYTCFLVYSSAACTQCISQPLRPITVHYHGQESGFHKQDHSFTTEWGTVYLSFLGV